MGAVDDLLAEYGELDEPETPAKPAKPTKAKKYPSVEELFGKDPQPQAPAAREEQTAPVETFPIPRPTTDYRTTTATTPEEAVREAEQKTKDRNDTAAFGYGVARGASLGGVDRLVGLGTAIGERLGASDQVPARPGAYREGRREYLEGEDKSREISPWYHLGGEVVGGSLLPGGAAKGTLGRLAVSGGMGALSGALNTREDDVKPMASNAWKAGLFGAGVEGTAGTAARKLIRNAPKREINRTVSEVVENEAGRVNTKAANALANDIKDVEEVLKASPEVRKAIQKGPEKARPLVRQKMADAMAGQSDRYALVDETLPKMSVVQLMNKLVKAEESVPTRDIALVKPILRKMRDSIKEDLAPRWGGMSEWTSKKIEIPTNELRAWVTSSQKAGKLALVGVDPSEATKAQGIAAKIANDILESRLDAAAAKGGQHVKDAVDQIRESDRLFSAWKNIDHAQETLQKKMMAQNAGLNTRLASAGASTEATGALAATAAGRPDIGLAIVGKRPVLKGAGEAARYVNDKIVAPMQEAASRGAPWAVISRMATENGFPQGVARAIFERTRERPEIPEVLPPPAQTAVPLRGKTVESTAPAWPRDYATSTRTQ